MGEQSEEARLQKVMEGEFPLACFHCGLLFSRKREQHNHVWQEHTEPDFQYRGLDFRSNTEVKIFKAIYEGTEPVLKNDLWKLSPGKIKGCRLTHPKYYPGAGKEEKFADVIGMKMRFQDNKDDPRLHFLTCDVEGCQARVTVVGRHTPTHYDFCYAQIYPVEHNHYLKDFDQDWGTLQTFDPRNVMEVEDGIKVKTETGWVHYKVLFNFLGGVSKLFVCSAHPCCSKGILQIEVTEGIRFFDIKKTEHTHYLLKTSPKRIPDLIKLPIMGDPTTTKYRIFDNKEANGAMSNTIKFYEMYSKDSSLTPRQKIIKACQETMLSTRSLHQFPTDDIGVEHSPIQGYQWTIGIKGNSFTVMTPLKKALGRRDTFQWKTICRREDCNGVADDSVYCDGHSKTLIVLYKKGEDDKATFGWEYEGVGINVLKRTFGPNTKKNDLKVIARYEFRTPNQAEHHLTCYKLAFFILHALGRYRKSIGMFDTTPLSFDEQMTAYQRLEPFYNLLEMNGIRFEFEKANPGSDVPGTDNSASTTSSAPANQGQAIPFPADPGRDSSASTSSTTEDPDISKGVPDIVDNTIPDVNFLEPGLSIHEEDTRGVLYTAQIGHIGYLGQNSGNKATKSHLSTNDTSRFVRYSKVLGNMIPQTEVIATVAKADLEKVESWGILCGLFGTGLDEPLIKNLPLQNITLLLNKKYEKADHVLYCIHTEGIAGLNTGNKWSKKKGKNTEKEELKKNDKVNDLLLSCSCAEEKIKKYLKLFGEAFFKRPIVIVKKKIDIPHGSVYPFILPPMFVL